MTEKSTVSYHFVDNLSQLLPEIPGETIVSRKVFNNDQARVTLFGFAPGEELTEHTAASPAILHFLSGEADLTLGQDTMSVKAGSWAYMPARLPHSIVALTAVEMLLVLL